MGRKQVVEVAGISFSIGIAITFMTVFNNAVISGGKTVVKINEYGEMIPELILLNLVALPTISVTIYYWIQNEDKP